jgi:hypothetical protein
MTENFNDYMIFFKQLEHKEKQKIIYEQLQILSGFTNGLCKELEIPNEVIVNRELLDMKNENYAKFK